MNTTLFASSFALPTPSAAVAPGTLCPSTVPLVLLPVRLETRFFSLPGNGTELRLRIYPDKIHVDTHQPELTTDERTWGTQYWQRDWIAGNDIAARADAWTTLAARFGAARAAWIVRVLQPTNIRLRPTTPVPNGTQPAVQPVFPKLPPVGANGESAWRHAPQARLMPDRWIAVLHSAGQVALTVTGKDISRPLAAGPNPAAAPPDAKTEAAIVAGDQLALDPDMMWMVDFDAAEAKGMALRMTVPPATLAAGIDSLVVFGVATSLGVTNTSTQLANLLDAHHYTDGLELLRLGTPTNNTDDRRAGYSSEDPAHARSFGSEILADSANAPNAVRVGTALGVPAARIAPTLGHVGGAVEDHDRNLRSMNTALWPVSWGYYLSNMIGAETGLTPASIDWARGHFINHVRGGGPFPTLRCGPQPYGILPVTSLDLWAPGATEAIAPQETWLKDLLLDMRDKIWRPVVPNVARIGLRTIDPDGDLADVMRTDGMSWDYMTRYVLGRQYVEHLHAFDALDFRATAQAQDTVAGTILDALRLPSGPGQRPRAAHGFLWDFPRGLAVPLVQVGEVSPWQPLQPNYIGVLLATPTIHGLIDARPSPSARDHTTSLLQSLLRHAMLREIATVTARLASTIPGNDLATLLRDLELVDLVDAAPVNHVLQTPPKTLHWRRQLDLTAPGLPAGTTIRQYLEGLTSFTTPAVASLGELRASLMHLQTLDSESLQLLMQGTLDLSAHRLDAWITSFATKRLSLMTAKGPVGQYVGAYGWVENLRPATTPAPLPAASMPPGEQAPLYPLVNDTGFIHAPSLTHASTAALLRNAHLGPAQLGPDGTPLPDGPFAIDLSSRRVREATRLLDGVREGQPLGALLGYRLERRLHELGLDIFIAPLRRIAPLVVRQREATTASADALGADNVVDGLALLRFRQTPGDTTVSGALASVTATAPQRTQAMSEVDMLADAIDGLSDALTAEATYQMVRGNTARLANTLSAIAHGDGVPPELEVARMPRTGTPITHRVAVLFSGAANAGPNWTTTSTRSTSERWLNAWVRAQLGDATHVRCTVERLDDATGSVVQTAKFALNDVPLAPLDLVYDTQPAGQSSQGSASSCMVEQRVLYHARRMTNGFGGEATIRLQHARPTDLAAGETTLFDVLEQARAIRRLLEQARGLRPDDITPPGRSTTATIDLAELEARVGQYESSFAAAHAMLAGLVAHADGTPAESTRTAILAVGTFGIPQAVPSRAVGDTPEIRAALAAQAAAMLKISQARLDKGAALRGQPASTDPRTRCDQLIERARAVYGDEFVCLPTFSCDTSTGTELNRALSAGTAQQGGDALAVHGWFTRSSRVRDLLARLGACMRGAEILASGTRLDLRVAQLPFDATERWVGLPPLAGKTLAPNKLSLVVQPLTAVNASQPLSGLLIDEWVEVVPSGNETTALAFQFDPPDSFAPQNILVAVPPVPGQDWTIETLRRVLVETLDLAKLRAVDGSLLGAAAQYLPALYVPFNSADDAVSTDFAPLTVIAAPATAWSLDGLTVTIGAPGRNATVGRSLSIAGSVTAAPGCAVAGMQIQFGAGGPVFPAALAGQSWSWQGVVPTSIRPGQSFQIIAIASGFNASQVPITGQAVEDVVLENVVPMLTVDPFPAVVTVTRVPYVTALSGTISEGNGAPYTTPLVQYRIGTAPLASLTVTQGRWSVPLSLPAGDNLITVQASDAFGSFTAFQKLLRVVVGS